MNSALQRARATLEASDASVVGASPSVEEADAELLARYVEAFERYDMDALTSLIREDATQSMPPYDLWLRGRDDILSFWVGPGHMPRLPGITRRERERRARLRAVPAAPGRRGVRAWALQVVEIEDGRIVELTFFLDTQRLFPLFGLPLEI